MGKTIDEDLPDQTTIEPRPDLPDYKQPVYVNAGGQNQKLTGYKPRKYVDVGILNSLYEFNKIKDAFNPNPGFFDHDVLAECGSEIVGTVGIQKYPQTDDGYTWFAGLYFRGIHNAPDTEIAILFPFVHNSKARLEGGSQLDRSISVHTKGNIPKTSIDPVLKRLEDKLKEVADTSSG